MDCMQAQENLSPFLDGELNDAEHAAIKEHLGSCARCRQEFASIEEVVKMLQDLSLKEIEAPAQIKAGVLAGIEKLETAQKQTAQVPRRKWLIPAAGAAAVLLVLLWAGGLLNFPKNAPSQVAENDQAQMQTAQKADLPQKQSEQGFKTEAIMPQNSTMSMNAESSDNAAAEIAPNDPDAAPRALVGSAEPNVEEQQAPETGAGKMQMLAITGNPADQLIVIEKEIDFTPKEKISDDFWQKYQAVVQEKSASLIKLELAQSNFDRLMDDLAKLGEVSIKQEAQKDLTEELRQERAKLLELEQNDQSGNSEELTQQRQKVAELEGRRDRAYLTIKIH